MAIKFVRRMKAFDRRKHVRINLNCLVKYTTAGSSKTTKHLTNLVNVSESGALLNTFEQKLEKKAKVELEFQLPNSVSPLIISGEVMRTYARRKDSFQSGIQFNNADKKDVELIKEFISSRLKSQKR